MVRPSPSLELNVYEHASLGAQEPSITSFYVKEGMTSSDEDVISSRLKKNRASMSSNYHLHSKKFIEVEDIGVIEGGLDPFVEKPCLARRKSTISKEKSKDSKEVQEGKQLTMKWGSWSRKTQ